MQRLKNFIKWSVIVLTVLIATLYLTNTNYLITAVRTIYFKGHVTAYLEDYKEFDNRTVQAGTPQSWPIHKNYNKVSETLALNKINKELGTIAFLIIKNDSIWFENYDGGFDKDSKTNSFSMVKSMVAAMLGKAIMEGDIKSLDQPIGDFLPEFKDGLAAKTTVGDLASMASGTDWDEAYYSPFSITTRAYFDTDLRAVMRGVKIVETPGERFKYSSGDIELLGMVLEKATGTSLSNYLSDQFWKPLGAAHEALWQIDSKDAGMEKAYCCLASNARDFARFGKLYKDYGKWQGEQLLDSTFVAKSLSPRFAESPQYGYGWWLYSSNGKSFFMMRGHLGQYVMVEPNDNVIIVRLGHQKLKDAGVGQFSDDIQVYIDEAYNMLEGNNF